MEDRARFREDGSLIHAPDIHPGQLYLHLSPYELRMIRLMCKYPPDRWNKRLRKNRNLMTWAERSEREYWDRLKAWERTWRPVYGKLAAQIEAADVEWDRTHEWNEEKQRWETIVPRS